MQCTRDFNFCVGLWVPQWYLTADMDYCTVERWRYSNSGLHREMVFGQGFTYMNIWKKRFQGENVLKERLTFIRRSLIRVVCGQCGFIRMVSCQGGVWSVWVHQGGILSGWCLVSVGSSGWHLVRVVSRQGGLSWKPPALYDERKLSEPGFKITANIHILPSTEKENSNPTKKREVISFLFFFFFFF